MDVAAKKYRAHGFLKSVVQGQLLRSGPDNPVLHQRAEPVNLQLACFVKNLEVSPSKTLMISLATSVRFHTHVSH
jgi:hypothetical protein